MQQDLLVKQELLESPVGPGILELPVNLVLLAKRESLERVVREEHQVKQVDLEHLELGDHLD